MCVPALAAIGTIVSMAGSLVSGIQAQQMGRAQQQAYEQQARADAQAAGYESQQERKRQEAAAAQARAQVGASGVALSGSPTEVLLANARENQLEIDAIRYGSSIRQNNLRTQGQIAKMQGNQAMVGAIFKAGGSVVSGLSGMYDPNRAQKFGLSIFR
jgi:sRNA-binding protein